MDDKVLKVALVLEQEELVPYKASEGSAGVDLRASASCLIYPGQTVLVPTGMRMAIPNGYHLEIRPRSGLSLKTRLRVVNSPGTIDSDYRDEVKIILQNQFSQSEIPSLLLSSSPLFDRFGPIKDKISVEKFLQLEGQNIDPMLEKSLLFVKEESIYLDENGNPWGTENVEAGERIAQAILSYTPEWQFDLVEDFSNYIEDRGGGFGHSGVK